MKNKASNITRQIALSLIIFLTGNTNGFAAGGKLFISQTPLFLGAGVQPNIFFVSDDSGSMDWETMMGRYWRYDAYDPDEFRDTPADFESHGSSLEEGGYGTWVASQFRSSTPTMGGGYGYIYGRNSAGDEDNVYWLDCTHPYASAAEDCGGGGLSPLDLDWRVRSSGLNQLFYNADIIYKPWSGPCGYGDCIDAEYTAARSDPYNTQPGYKITRNLDIHGDAAARATGGLGGFVYEVWVDDSGWDPSDNGPMAASNFNATGYASSKLQTGQAGLDSSLANGWVDLWDSHIRVRVNSASSITVQLIAYNPAPHDHVGTPRGLNETVVFQSTFGSTSACYNVLGSNPMVQSIRDQIVLDINAAPGAVQGTGVSGEGCRTIGEVRQNIANWFQYYRRRAFPVKNAIAAVIDAQPTFRYGMTLLNENSDTGSNQIFIEVPGQNTNITLHNELIKEKYFSYRQKSRGTPLRMALKLAGDYYMGNAAQQKELPIIETCQKNFTILFTDGYWNSWKVPPLGDADGDGANGGETTVADVAYYYYKKDLMPDMPNNVSIDKGEEDLKNGNPAETKTFQHMVTFTVAFGIEGNMYDLDNDEKPDFRSSGVAWTTGEATKDGDGALGWGDVSNGAEKIDDLWHAAFNSSGTYASASTPDDIIDKLVSAISNIAKRQSSAAAVALNSGTLNANSRVYQAAFNSTNWSGSIKSIPIQDGPVDIDGIPGDDSPSECDNYPTLGELCIDFTAENADGEWNAEKILETTLYKNRKIYTFSPDANQGVIFSNIADLDPAQQNALQIHPDTDVVEAIEVGQLRLDYIRGDNGNEGTAKDQFRKRKAVASGSSKLGDIVNSAPAFVGRPDSFYPDKLESDSYDAFKAAYKDRKGIVYVGANDGMLHAFDASNGGNKGSEIFAYVPGALIKKLPKLTSRTYNLNHQFFVDGSPIVFDAYSGGWKTLLVSSAGAGAQLVFGLDITDVTATTGLGVKNVKWEFTDDPRTVNGVDYGDIDLGYTIGDVSYARLNNGKWVAVFGNGFNNTEHDGNPSQSGNGVIYVVDAFTGALINKLDTGVGMAQDPEGASRPNGISRVTPVDLNGDYKADALYAGDLFGNVWEVDISESNPSAWAFTKTGSTGTPAPFYIAKDPSGKVQPITTAVVVKRHPDDVKDTLVLFGTGSYFQLNDAATTQKQTFYAIWNDRSGTVYKRANLLMQEVKGTQFKAGNEFRITSSADIKPASYQIDWSKHKGWYIDLPEVGERVNVEPILRGNRVIFVTLTPKEDPCEDGGSSWIMELSANNGSRLKQSPFDVNGDGIIDESDILNFSGDAATITSGVRAKGGIVASPGILNTQSDGVNTKELKFLSGTSGGIETIDESVDSSQRDRQSWRQLR